MSSLANSQLRSQAVTNRGGLGNKRTKVATSRFRQLSEKAIASGLKPLSLSEIQRKIEKAR